MSVTLEARKTPDAEDPNCWTLKISGLSYEQSKELCLRSKGWDIRFNGPDQPFLITKRDSEEASSHLSTSCLERLYELGYRVTSCKPVKDQEMVWTFETSKAA